MKVRYTEKKAYHLSLDQIVIWILVIVTIVIVLSLFSDWGKEMMGRISGIWNLRRR